MHAAGLVTMAYYYFDFRDVKKQDCYGLLSSLFSQLSVESDSCYDVLSKLYSDKSCGMRKPNVDALQFSGETAREEVLEFVEEIVNLNLPNIHLCVGSRPEMDMITIPSPPQSRALFLVLVSTQAFVYAYNAELDHGP
jgi:hypothetical protein